MPQGGLGHLDLSRIAQDLQIRKVQVEAVVQLLDDGNTIPFITRYRKERTGGLNEELLRIIQARLAHVRQLAERKQTILKTIESQGKLTDELRAAIGAADNPKRLEDLYLPYKPKKRTQATAARDKGLEPFALSIWNSDPVVANLGEVLPTMVNPEKELKTPDDVLLGAQHILAELIAEAADVRSVVRMVLWESGKLCTAKSEKLAEGQGLDYKDYFQFTEPVRHMPPHRILAINRGEKENALTVKLEWDAPAGLRYALDNLPLPLWPAPAVPAAPPDAPAPAPVAAQDAPAPVAAQDAPAPAAQDAPAPVAPQDAPAPVAAQDAPAPVAPPIVGQDSDPNSGGQDQNPEPKGPPSEGSAPTQPPAAHGPGPRGPTHGHGPGHGHGHHGRMAAARELAARRAAALQTHPHADFLKKVTEDALNRLLVPSLEREIRRELTRRAEDHAVDVFARNLRSKLLAPPLRGKRVLAIDPGFRTGCKLAALDETGNLLEDAVIFPHPPQNHKDEAKARLEALVRRHQLTVIAIGNGTACRETEEIVSEVIALLEARRTGTGVVPANEIPAPSAAPAGDAAPVAPSTMAAAPPPEPAAAAPIGSSPGHSVPSALQAEPPTAAAGGPSPECSAPSVPPAEPPGTGSAERTPEDSAPSAPPAEPAAAAPLQPNPDHSVPGALPAAQPQESSAQHSVLSTPPAAAPLEPNAAKSVPSTAGSEPFPAPPAPGSVSDRARAQAPAAPPKPPLPEAPADVAYVIVNEAGASVYSASPVGREEFPNFDATLRGTISIGRRLQDPLAELVKIDPQHVGVGLYQHDVNPKHLRESLDGVIESCVNTVGVDLNTASVPLLRHVSGMNQLVARDLVEYRKANGPFTSRDQLLQVPGIGEARYTQAAGFLKLDDGGNPLDRTWIHPESYGVATQILADLGFGPEALGDRDRLNELRDKLKAVNPGEVASRLRAGVPTVCDILDALARPGRDPRDDLPPPAFKKGILKLEDLQAGMELKGTVLNVVDFGAFIDIGLKDSGLVHISQMANRYIRSPYEVAAVGDVVNVWVLAVDKERHRVSLTMIKPGTERKLQERRPPRRGGARGERAERGEPGVRDQGPRREPGGRPPRPSGQPRAAAAPQGGGDRPRGGPPRQGSGGPPRQGGGGPQRGGPPQRGRSLPPRGQTRIGSHVRPGQGRGPAPQPGGAEAAPPAAEGAAAPAQQAAPPRKPRRSPPKPNLSQSALAGATPLGTFAELAAFWEAKAKQPPEEVPVEATAEQPSSQPEPEAVPVPEEHQLPPPA
jgi:uncharacterized protein